MCTFQVPTYYYYNMEYLASLELGIYEPSESNKFGLGSWIAKYSSPLHGLGSHMYTFSGGLVMILDQLTSGLESLCLGPGGNIKL